MTDMCPGCASGRYRVCPYCRKVWPDYRALRQGLDDTLASMAVVPGAAVHRDVIDGALDEKD